MVLKKTGINPVVFKGSDSAHDFIGRVFKLLFAVVVFVVLIHSFLPGVYEYLIPSSVAATVMDQIDGDYLPNRVFGLDHSRPGTNG